MMPLNDKGLVYECRLKNGQDFSLLKQSWTVIKNSLIYKGVFRCVKG